MTQLLHVLQKAIPQCRNHSQEKASRYDLQQSGFSCEKCIHSDFPNQLLKIQNLILNPILLMSHTTSSFSVSHYQAFQKLITQCQKASKIAKINAETMKSFMAALNEGIESRMRILQQLLSLNEKRIQQIDEGVQALRTIQGTYTEQFFQDVEEKFIEGTSDELKKIFTEFSLNNENPFLSISQKVEVVMKISQGLLLPNWQEFDKLRQRILGSSLWSAANLFVSTKPQDLQCKSSEESFLPGEEIFHNQLQEMGLGFFDELQIQTVKFLPNRLQLYRAKGEKRVLLDELQLDNPMEQLYLLPNQALMGVNYDKVTFFSFHDKKLSKKTDLNLSGCSKMLVMTDSLQLIMLCNDKVYSLKGSEVLQSGSPDSNVDQKITLIEERAESVEYVYRQGKKKEDKILIIKRDGEKKIINSSQFCRA